MSRFQSLCVAVVSVIGFASGPVLGSAPEVPMTETAMREALATAAHDAAAKLLAAIPPGTTVKTIAVEPFENDPSRQAQHAFEAAITKLGQPDGISLVVPTQLGGEQDPRWRAITRAWVSGSRDDVYEGEADAVALLRTAMAVRGELTRYEVNDTGAEADASLSMQGLLCVTGEQVSVSGAGSAWVPGGRTFLALLRQWVVEPWFWIVVGAIGIVLAAAFIGAVPVLRKVFLASKPRRISR
jgi:hypothetical protein